MQQLLNTSHLTHQANVFYAISSEKLSTYNVDSSHICTFMWKILQMAVVLLKNKKQWKERLLDSQDHSATRYAKIRCEYCNTNRKSSTLASQHIEFDDSTSHSLLPFRLFFFHQEKAALAKDFILRIKSETKKDHCCLPFRIIYQNASIFAHLEWAL